MKILQKAKDGGPESTVWAYILIEIKSLFSIMLLKFEDGTRESFHSHAFNAISWLFKGTLLEVRIDHGNKENTKFIPSLKPILTSRENTHMVFSFGNSWVLTFRGPWNKTWKEIENNTVKTLTHGRQILKEN